MLLRSALAAWSDLSGVAQPHVTGPSGPGSRYGTTMLDWYAVQGKNEVGFLQDADRLS